MKRVVLIFSTLALASTLASCNAARSPTPAAQGSAGTPTPVAATAGGSDCGGVISRYRSVVKADADTGNVNKSVYSQIDEEIRRAEAACSAGRDAEARSLVSASKSRHGYPG